MEYDADADGIGSYNDAIEALRMSLTAKFEIAVKALVDIKRFTQDSPGPRIQRAFITARDALIAVDRNPAPVKRG